MSANSYDESADKTKFVIYVLFQLQLRKKKPQPHSDGSRCEKSSVKAMLGALAFMPPEETSKFFLQVYLVWSVTPKKGYLKNPPKIVTFWGLVLSILMRIMVGLRIRIRSDPECFARIRIRNDQEKKLTR